MDFGCVKHASSCMLQSMIFPAIIPHATIPLCSGWRISLQIQIERQAYAGFFPRKKAESSTSGIRLKSIDDKDNKLFCFIKHNVERILDSRFSGKKGKDNVSHTNGTEVSCLDMVSPGNCLLQRDKKKPHTDFIKALQQQNEQDRMTKNAPTILKDSLAHLLLKELCVTESTLKDLRIILVSLSSTFDIHDDVGQYESKSTSVTLHMNVCTSHDYFPGNRGMSKSIFEKQEETKWRKDNDIFLHDPGDNEHIKAKLGSLDAIYSVDKKRFLTWKEQKRYTMMDGIRKETSNSVSKNVKKRKIINWNNRESFSKKNKGNKHNGGEI